ncbi:MAG: YggS family pyridoxal phosphate-dependent enzyme [Candidatus Dormibacteraceae bacterium]
MSAEAVGARLYAVRERIRSAGRDPDQITILAVTKGRGLAACQDALACGLAALGENRVQEALPKLSRLPGAEWHLIGHLQTNKVRRAAGRFHLIQSIDSPALAAAIAERAPAQAVLLQVNVAREPGKHGTAPERAVEVAALVAGLLPLRGLMAMGPLAGDPRAAFEELAALREEAEQRCGTALPVLSMGMSGDFEAAVAAGSTMLRLGRSLFGEA